MAKKTPQPKEPQVYEDYEYVLSVTNDESDDWIRQPGLYSKDNPSDAERFKEFAVKKPGEDETAAPDEPQS